MNKLRKQMKAELVGALPIELKFDTAKLADNDHVYVNVGRIVGGIGIGAGAVAFLFVATIGGALIAAGLHFQDGTKKVSRNYSAEVSDALKEQYFASLNSVAFPSTAGSSSSPSADFVASLQSFGNKTFHQVKGMAGNVAFTPASLYSNLMMVSYAYNGDQSLFDSVLGLGQEERLSQYRSMYQSDYFVKDNSTLQMYNGSFQDQTYAVNQSYIDNLTKMYAEAYKVDFGDERTLSSIADWANDHVGESLVSPDDLKVSGDDYPLIYFLSTFYFQSSWSSTFSTAKTQDRTFYLADGSEAKVPFMNHLYGGQVYDFGSYVRTSDAYSSGMKITYFTPKNRDDDILDLIGSKDIFSLEGSTLASTEFVNLSLPRFTSSYSIDLTEAMKSLGLSAVYSSDSRVLTTPFSDYPSSATAYLQVTKEKNKIVLNEDGTKVTSVTFSLGLAGAAGPGDSASTYDVVLDSPFLYYISDQNDVPLYIGMMRNPA